MSISPQRQVILDTETTGMTFGAKPYLNHNIIEIGAVEVINRRLTGRTYHVYIKPPRNVDPEAVRVHGITDEMLADKPSFAEIAPEFLTFIQGAELIIHNAPFDVGFIDHEFSMLNDYPTVNAICEVTDTLVMAKKMYPGKRNNLDALCSRLGVDNTKRVLHGALLDAEILADVYLAMTGGQSALFGEEEPQQAQAPRKQDFIAAPTQNVIEDLPIFYANEADLAAHEAYLTLVEKKSKGQCLWLQRENANAPSQ